MKRETELETELENYISENLYDLQREYLNIFSQHQLADMIFKQDGDLRDFYEGDSFLNFCSEQYEIEMQLSGEKIDDLNRRNGQ